MLHRICEMHADGFYGGTIILEEEDGLDLVGVRLWADGLAIYGMYIVHGFEDLQVLHHEFVLSPQWRWKYRGRASSGSPSSRLAGFLTRSHLALRLSFPVEQARRAFAQLVCVTLATAGDAQVITSAIVKLSSRYRRVFHREYVDALCESLKHKDVWVIHQLGV